MKQLDINCPRCGNKTTWYENPFRPFCSEKCRLIDLGCWASGEYAVAGEKVSQPEDNK